MNRKHMHCQRARCSRHRGGILLIVLITMMGVAFLASQGVRLISLSNLAADQRVKTAQLNELLELGRMRLADEGKAGVFSVEVAASRGVPARVGNIAIEKKSETDERWRIIVRFPHNQPNELTVTWESP